MSRYAFGDDEPALARLRLVAAAYEPVSGAFLSDNVTEKVGVALDLGCGPGFSTRLLHDVLRPQTLIGVDASDQFLRTARDLVATATFVTHDVTANPLPGAPADVIYARLLLAHLPSPVSVVNEWREQLAPGGRVLIEDLEDIEAPRGPLRRYDEISAEIVRRAGGVMYAGAELRSLGGQSARVTVPAAYAAQIYLFNVRRWLADPARRSENAELAELEDGLQRVCEQEDGKSVSWIVRQLVLRR